MSSNQQKRKGSSSLNEYILVDSDAHKAKRRKSRKKACAVALGASQVVLFCGAAIGLILYLIENATVPEDSETFYAYPSDQLQYLFNISHNVGVIFVIFIFFSLLFVEVINRFIALHY